VVERLEHISGAANGVHNPGFVISAGSQGDDRIASTTVAASVRGARYQISRMGFLDFDSRMCLGGGRNSHVESPLRSEADDARGAAA